MTTQLPEHRRSKNPDISREEFMENFVSSRKNYGDYKPMAKIPSRNFFTYYAAFNNEQN